MVPTVLYDACVLYPAPLRDLLIRLAMAKLFRARWTDEIHDEWIRNVAANRPEISAESLTRCRRLMDQHVPDCLVVGYESLIPTLKLPDPDDRHVLAAAIHTGAGLIVTFNLKDFPASVLSSYAIEAVHPDDFLLSLWDVSPGAILEVVRGQRADLKSPPKTADELLGTLARCGITKTVERLRDHSSEV